MVGTSNMIKKGKSRDDSNRSDDGCSSDAHIQVVVRVRPENEKEAAGGYEKVVHALDENVLIFDPKVEYEPEFYHGRKVRGREFLKRKHKDIRFIFDSVFDADTSNRDVYEGTLKSILGGVFDGYNCSVFAYGATGAGKTFTMLGSPSQPGIVFHTMVDLYNRVEQLRDEKTCEIAVCYVEVYNEQIRDLLATSGYLPIRDDPQKGSVITGLTFHKPASAEELLNMLAYGNTKRTQHPTDANAESSRSHAVFQVFLRQKDRTASISADVQVSKMSLIDLAGSERATVTTNRGARMREGANINRSLLALGNCINALAEGKSNNYVPYRDSKLTRLLKDSLGGNCKTIMIAAVSPSSMTYEDTLNTLKYADRAKNIKTNLKKNVVSVDFHVSNVVTELRKQISDLKEKVRRYEENEVANAAAPQKIVVYQSPPEQPDVERLQVTLYNVFQDKMALHREVLDLEFGERELMYRVWRKQRQLERSLCIVSDSAVVDKVKAKLEKTVTLTEAKKDALRSKRAEVQCRLDDNNSWLQRVHSEGTTSCGANGQLPTSVASTLRTRCLEVEQRDSTHQVAFLQRLCRAQEREIQSQRRLLSGCLPLACKVYWLLHSYGLCSTDIVKEFEAVQSLVEGERDVTWGDDNGESNHDDGAGAEDGNSVASFEHIVTMTPVDSSLSKYMEATAPSECQDETASLARRRSLAKGPLTPLKQAAGGQSRRTRTVSSSDVSFNTRFSVPDGDVSFNGTVNEPVKRQPNTILKRSAVSASVLTGPTPAKQRREDPKVKTQHAGSNRLTTAALSLPANTASLQPALRSSRSTTSLLTSSTNSGAASTLNLTVTKSKPGPSATTLNSVGQGQVAAKRALLTGVSTASVTSANRAQVASDLDDYSLAVNTRLGAATTRNSPTVINNANKSGRKANVVGQTTSSVVETSSTDSTMIESNSPLSSYGGFMFAVRQPPATSRVEDSFAARVDSGQQKRVSADGGGGAGADLNSTFTMVDGIYPLPEEMDATTEAGGQKSSVVERDSTTVLLPPVDQRYSLDLFGSSAVLDTTVDVKPHQPLIAAAPHGVGGSGSSTRTRSPLTSRDNLPIKSSTVNPVKKSQPSSVVTGSSKVAPLSFEGAPAFRVAGLKRSKTTMDVHAGVAARPVSVAVTTVAHGDRIPGNLSPFRFKAPSDLSTTKQLSQNKSGRKHRRSVTADGDKVNAAGARRALLQQAKDVAKATRVRFLP